MAKQKEKNMKGGSKTNTEFYVQLALIGVLAILIVYNAGRIYGGTNGLVTGVGTVSASGIIPKGVPEVYGSEMGISYDDVSPSNPRLADATINKLRQYENLDLTDAQMQRYINVAGAISCEYCCGAESIIFSNGERACGCAHSFAMRGLAKYLLINHPDMSDEQVLAEIGKWKVLFFPGIHEQKAAVLEAQGVDSSDYINLASNKYRGIEQGKTSAAGGGMVGGC